MIEDFRAFYERHGSDYDLFLKRLMGKESLVKKYLMLFLKDSTYSQLMKAVEEKNYHDILTNAHTLKGLALNLNLTNLSNYSAELVDKIRSEEIEEIDQLFAKMKTEYEKILEELNG